MVNKQRNSLRANHVRHLNDAKFKSALDQFRAKTAMAGVCSKFAFSTATTIEELKNCFKNMKTWRFECKAKTVPAQNVQTGEGKCPVALFR